MAAVSSYPLVTPGSTDTALGCDASGTVKRYALGGYATTYVYNTYTDAANYERGSLQWSSNALTLGTEAAGTGTARDLLLAPASGKVVIPQATVASWGDVAFARSGVGKLEANNGTVGQYRDFQARTFIAVSGGSNLIPYSEDLSAGVYRRNNINVTTDVAVAPNGATTADLVACSGSGTADFDFYSVDYGQNGGLTQTVSLYVKRPASNAASQIQIGLAGAVAVFDTTTGAVVSGSGVSQSIGNGWWRFSASKVKSNAYQYWDISYPADANTTNGLYLWGIQDENASSAGPYTSTSGAAVTATPAVSLASGMVQLGSFTVAGLSALTGVAPGSAAYASNGRKAGEAAGSGSGIPVWSDGANWRTYYDNTVAAA